jgi:hypothetical protein
MAGVAQIPRSRGSVCGLLLILLGAWGGLSVFVGPYFHFGFTPDKAWGYSSGRLYLSVIPGAAALLGGLFVLATRSRAVGMLAGLVAALGGAWFIIGLAVVVDVVKNTTISPGFPMNPSGGVETGVTGIRAFAEQTADFTGLGILIVFVAGLAVARFSMIAAKDASLAGSDYPAYPGGDQFPESHDEQGAQDQYPTSPSPFPAQQQYPPGTGQFPTPTGQFPAATGQFPAGQQYPPPGDNFPTAAD